MTLYIFRCVARPRMYGATRYETGSNLPKDQSSGGWKFAQRIELPLRGSQRLGIDPETLRRQIKKNGWCVWDESPRESSAGTADSRPMPRRQPPPPAASEIATSTQSPAPITKMAPPATPEVIPDRYVAAAAAQAESRPMPRRQPPPPAASEIATSEESPAPMTQMAPLPAAEVIPDRHVAAAAAHAESTPMPRRQPPAPVVETAASEVAPAPITKMAPPATAEVIPEEATHVVDTPSARHQVVWFDIPVRDLDRALRFYSAVLGSRLKKEQAGPGVAIAVLPHAEGSIGGSLVQTMDSKPSESGPLLYLNTNGRLDEALNAVESHGGKVLSAMHSIEPFGFRAIVLDSEGNRVALHSM